MARANPFHRHARILGRLALVFGVAFPAGFGLAIGQPATVSSAPCIYLSAERFDATGDDARNLNGEWVRVTNRCSRLIGVGGWRIKDRAGNRYTFASGVVMGRGHIYLHTGKGTNHPGHRYWGRIRPVWDNTAETAYLLNRSGTIVSRLSHVVPTTTTTTPPPTTTPAPTATPAPAATPPPATPPPPTATPPPTTDGTVAFGSRPQSGAISLRDCRDVIISNKTFQDLGANVIAIRLENCTNVTIQAVDFINVAEGVYALNSSNIKVVDSRYRNILGPHERDGHNRGNFVQFHNVSGGLIDHNKGKGGDTEDVVSLYRTSNVIVEDNHFEGTNWSSTSGSGIALSDGGGSNNHARRNTLLNIGQVGIFIAGGTNNSITDNVIYGEPWPLANVGMYVWNQSSSTCSGNVVSGNRVHFQKADGTRSGYWEGGGCGTVTKSGNDLWAPLDLTKLRVVL